MACYKPLKGYRSAERTSGGKQKIVFDASKSLTAVEIPIPCGQCIGCRLERSRQWAIRCVHEASLHDQNSFITLTYAPRNLPENGNLSKRDFQLFMKRLRKEIAPRKVRFYHCGEYGSGPGQRPHYHACLFGYDFPDKYLFKVVRGISLFRSPLLEDLWPYGFATIGDVTFESAAYVARYIVKKQTGKQAKNHYEKITHDGEIIRLEPEYTTMSRKPGIARDWFEKYETDVFPNDSVVHKGREQKPPRYYENLFEHRYPDEMEEIKLKRKLKSKLSRKDNTPERLATRMEVKLAQTKMLKRELHEN